MSAYVQADFECRCGHVNAINVANGIHVSTDPDMRQAVLDGTFHHFTCSECRVALVVEDVLPYTDFPRQHMFTVVPPPAIHEMQQWVEFSNTSFHQTMEVGALPLVREWAPHMKRRLVFGLDSLREKLLVFDAGLDDRVLEILKLKMLEDLQLTGGLEGRFLLTHIDDDTMFMEYGATPSESLEVPLAYELYSRARWDIESLRDLCPPLTDGLAVDYRVAVLDAAA
jgi:hypothetical protein